MPTQDEIRQRAYKIWESEGRPEGRADENWWQAVGELKAEAGETTAHAPSLPTGTKVFISYSHADTKWLERLKIYLKPLVREGHLEVWDDTHIRPGDDWQQEIRTALDTANVAVLLISANFFASDFINADELAALLDAAQARGVRVLPVILSASMFAGHPRLARFQAVNSPKQPLDTMPRPKQALVLERVARNVESALHP